MALHQTTKLNPQLIDTLCQLNDLIGSLTSPEVRQAVKDIKVQMDASKEAEESIKKIKVEHENEIVKLNILKKENEKLSSDLKKQQDLIVIEKNENEKRISNLKSIQSAFDIRKDEWMKHTSLINEEHKNRNNSLVEREQKANDLLHEAHKIKAEYVQKLADLKKITG